MLYERHPTMLLIRRCRRGSTTSGESRFVKRTFGSIEVSTGLQSHIPKVRNTRSAYPACTILPVLAALSLITSQPRYSFTSPSSVPWNRVRSSLRLIMAPRVATCPSSQTSLPPGLGLFRANCNDDVTQQICRDLRSAKRAACVTSDFLEFAGCRSAKRARTCVRESLSLM